MQHFQGGTGDSSQDGGRYSSQITGRDNTTFFPGYAGLGGTPANPGAGDPGVPDSFDWQWNNPGNTNKWGFLYGQPSSQNPVDSGGSPSGGNSPAGSVTVGDPTDATGPSGGSVTVGTPTDVTGNGGDTPTMTDKQMIDKLGYDPGDPRNDLTKGFGSGVPTQRAIGMIGNFLGNAAFPGLGMLTGAAAAKITQMIQNGAGKQAVQNAIKQWQSGGAGGDVTIGDLTDVTGNGPGGGKGNPFGGLFGGLPQGFTEGNRFGGGAPTFEGPGFTGPSWSPGGSIYGGKMNPNMNLAGSWTNLGASGGNLGQTGIGNAIAAGFLNNYRKFGTLASTDTPSFGSRISPFMMGNPQFAQNVSAPGLGAVVYGTGSTASPVGSGAGLPRKFAS